MRSVLLLSLLLLVASVYGQQKCTFYSPAKVQTRFAGHTPFNEAPAVASGTAGAADTAVVRIPVVVHVLYHTALYNISDEQVKSAINALNRDYRRRNADTVHTPASFKAVAADMGLEFVLATSDPLGRATTGIVRRQTTVKAWDNDSKIKYNVQGGSDAWDSKSYLNIWVGNLSRSLGYATTPGSNPIEDGVVITTNAFGAIEDEGAYSMGRTLVHETGHWLGLMHLWGDAACGDDGVADTPPQAGFTSGCPTGPVSTCNNDTAGDMYMNYMDFTNDACMNLFTKGQKEKARACLYKGKERYAITRSKGVLQPWNSTAADNTATESGQQNATAIFFVYPNPTAENIYFSLPDSVKTCTLQIITLDGTVAQKVSLATAQQVVSVKHLIPGVYLLAANDGKTVYRTRFVKLASGQ